MISSTMSSTNKPATTNSVGVHFGSSDDPSQRAAWKTTVQSFGPPKRVTRQATIEDSLKARKDAVEALKKAKSEGFLYDDSEDTPRSRSISPLRSCLKTGTFSSKDLSDSWNDSKQNSSSGSSLGGNNSNGSVKFGQQDDPESRAAWMTSESSRSSRTLSPAPPVRRESKESNTLPGPESSDDDNEQSEELGPFAASDLGDSEYFERLSSGASPQETAPIRPFRRTTIDSSKHLPAIQSDGDEEDSDEEKVAKARSTENSHSNEDTGKQRRRMMLLKAKDGVVPTSTQQNDSYKTRSVAPSNPDPLIAKCVIRASRRRTLTDTYTKPLLIALTEEDPMEIRTYLDQFDATLESLQDDIGIALEVHSETVGLRYKELVVSKNLVTPQDFWCRYFYKCDEKRILKDLRRRSKLGLLGQSTRNLLSSSNHSESSYASTNGSTRGLPRKSKSVSSPVKSSQGQSVRRSSSSRSRKADHP